MVIAIVHAFESLKSDGVDTTLVQPSNWNASHVITMAAGKMFGRDASGAGAAQELPLSFDTLANGNVDFTAGKAYMKLPRGTVAERPVVPAEAMVRFNLDDHVFEYYDGTSWVHALPSTASGFIPIGGVMGYAGRVEPTDNIFKYPNGQALVRADFPALLALLIFSSIVTMTIASPCVVTWTAHRLNTGDPIKFSTSGALATGLIAGTLYYVTRLTADTFKLSTTPGGADINTTGSQSGTHTAVSAPFGDGNGTTTFNAPDLRGRTIIGHDAMGAAIASRMVFSTGGVYGASLGYAGGLPTSTADVTVTISGTTGTVPGGGIYGIVGGGPAVGDHSHSFSGSGSDTSDAFNIVQPGLVMNMLIRVA